LSEILEARTDRSRTDSDQGLASDAKDERAVQVRLGYSGPLTRETWPSPTAVTATISVGPSRQLLLSAALWQWGTKGSWIVASREGRGWRLWNRWSQEVYKQFICSCAVYSTRPSPCLVRPHGVYPPRSVTICRCRLSTGPAGVGYRSFRQDQSPSSSPVPAVSRSRALLRANGLSCLVRVSSPAY
jgi:hypothetical protein